MRLGRDAGFLGWRGDRERGGFRGRRRRRGGRRDGRGDGTQRGSKRRARRRARAQFGGLRFAPRRRSRVSPVPAAPRAQVIGQVAAVRAAGRIPAHIASRRINLEVSRPGGSATDNAGPGAAFAGHSSPISASVSAPAAPVAATFPDDATDLCECQCQRSLPSPKPYRSATTHATCKKITPKRSRVQRHRLRYRLEPVNFCRQELADQAASSGASDAREITEEVVEEEKEAATRFEHSDRPTPSSCREPEAPVFAAPVFGDPRNARRRDHRRG